MPPFFPSWTNCSQPNKWHSAPVVTAVVLGILGVLVGLGSSIPLASLAPGAAAVFLAACLAGIAFCTWWLNVRLICLGGDMSAIGAVFLAFPPQATFGAWNFSNYDTDYTFDLLLWPFKPLVTLPAPFVGDTQYNAAEWDPISVGNLYSNNALFWKTIDPSLIDAFGQPVQAVKDQVNLILPQQTMASLNLSFSGQPEGDKGTQGDPQQLLLHCEIEGQGIYLLRIWLGVMAVLFGVAFVASAIPGLSWFLILLALILSLIAGPIIQNQQGQAPPAGGFGGSLNAYNYDQNPSALVDIVYCYGRWVYDSLHSGWNEFHPLHFMIKVRAGTLTPGAPATMTQAQLATGSWPSNLGAIKSRYDAQFKLIFTPETAATQQQPQNGWVLHPLLDGCIGNAPYQEPPAPTTT